MLGSRPRRLLFHFVFQAHCTAWNLDIIRHRILLREAFGSDSFSLFLTSTISPDLERQQRRATDIVSSPSIPTSSEQGPGLELRIKSHRSPKPGGPCSCNRSGQWSYIGGSSAMQLARDNLDGRSYNWALHLAAYREPILLHSSCLLGALHCSIMTKP